MALKAGRVGVAPDQVDEFGKINSEATEGYTKQEADAKFETQTHAASTYETKSDAAALQPINLLVPIEMLDGTKLTVESALQGLNTEKLDEGDIFLPGIAAAANSGSLSFSFDSSVGLKSYQQGRAPSSVFLLSIGTESVGALNVGSGLYMIGVSRLNGTAVYVTPINENSGITDITVTKEANSPIVNVSVTFSASNYHEAFICKIG